MKNEKYRKIIDSLPDATGIMDANSYLYSAVMVPFVQLNGKLGILFQKRANNIPQADEICFPGGKYDNSKDNKCADTAIRETSEELGLSDTNILLDKKLKILIAPVGKIVESFIGRLDIDSLNELDINKQEVKKVIWIPYNYFLTTKAKKYNVTAKFSTVYTKDNGKKITTFPTKKLGIPEKYHEFWHSSLYPIYTYTYQNEIIWGITARILVEIFEHKQ